MDWLTIQQLEKDTWVLSEYRHWEENHAYLLAGTEQALLIDTGLGVCDLFSAVRALTSLPVTVALTHAHWDHIGGCNAFSPPCVHPLEGPWLKRFPLPRETVLRMIRDGECGVFNPRLLDRFFSVEEKLQNLYQRES